MDTAVSQSSRAPLTIVPRSELWYEPSGAQRGYGHAGFPDIPPGAPGRLDFAPLVLVAEGELRPGEGTSMHRHERVDDVLLMLSGELEHRDSLGQHAVLGADDVMLMSAGRGVEHAEVVRGNDVVRALVIWLEADDPDGPPAISLTNVPRSERRNRLCTVASSGGGTTGRLRLRSRARLLAGVLDPGFVVEHRVELGRRAYLLSTDGAIRVNGRAAEAGDRVMVLDAGSLTIEALEATEVVVVDLP